MRGGRGRLAWRLAIRDIKKSKGRYLLAALVIGIVIAFATTIATLYRSEQVTPARQAQWMIGTNADAIVSWYADSPVQQSPDGRSVDSGQDTSMPGLDARFTQVFPGRPFVKLSLDYVVIRSDKAVVDFRPALEGNLDDPLLSGYFSTWQGAMPSSPGEVTINREDAATLGVGVGDTVEISPQSNTRNFVKVNVAGIHQNNYYGYQVGLSEGTMPDATVVNARPVWLLGGGPVSWSEVMNGNHDGFVTTSRAVLMDPPPMDQVPIYQSQDCQPYDQTWFVAIMVLAYLLIGGILVVLLIAPVFTIGARRSRRDYALLRAQGATSGDIRAVMLRSSGLVGAGASAIGAVLGIGISAVVVAVTHAADPTGFPDLQIGWLDLVGIAVAGTLISLVAAWFPARRATREDLVLALRDQETDLHKATRTRPLLVAIGAALTVGSAVFALVRHSPNWLLLTGLLSTLTLVLSVPLCLAGLARLAPRLPLAARVTLRDAHRRADRTGPTAVVVMAAVATASCVGMLATSSVATDAASWTMAAAQGTILIADGDYLAPDGDNFYPPPATTSRPEQLQQLRQVLETAVPVSQMVDVDMLYLDGDVYPKILIDPSLVCPAWADMTKEANKANGLPVDQGYPARADSPNCFDFKQGSTSISWMYQGDNIVVDDGTLVKALGLPGADKAAQALAAGKIVVTRPLDMWADGTAHIGVMMDDPVAMDKYQAQIEAASESGSTAYIPLPAPITMASAVADAVLVEMPSPVWEVFVPPSLVTSWPLDAQNPVVRRVGVIAITDQVLNSRDFDELTSRLAGVNVSNVHQSVSYDYGDQLQVMAIVIAAAALFALIVTWGASRLAIADMRPDLRVIYDVGAKGRTRRRIAALTTLIIGLVGSVMGVIAGLLLGLILEAVNGNSIAPQQQVTVIPWLAIALVAVGVPLVTAGLAWLLERRTGLTHRE